MAKVATMRSKERRERATERHFGPSLWKGIYRSTMLEIIGSSRQAKNGFYLGERSAGKRREAKLNSKKLIERFYRWGRSFSRPRVFVCNHLGTF